jgi:hypothetical protein
MNNDAQTLSEAQKMLGAAIARMAQQMKLTRFDATEVFGNIMRVAAEYDVRVGVAPDLDTALAGYMARLANGMGQLNSQALDQLMATKRWRAEREQS